MESAKQILIVDDSRVSRLMARQYILSLHANWIVEEASSGEEALQKIETFIPALILIDVNMPGMGGVAAAQQLRQRLPHAHISLLTANVQTATRNSAAEIGVGFMEKPITEARISQLIAPLEA
ncbi:response regulator [Pseudoduganella sp. LjRoot289]|uniref:response regulator n=1 Tax=Pseudoduganella sp. LjRoot289 TaxID=3342314 RepID=UPI003ED0EDD7